jgi:crotonobetainyl-CoA:carnitine CoA-transferase CaiB-like acyl-CoA transferase
VIGRSELAADPRYATVEARLREADALDELVSAWTREQEGRTAELRLQGAGVPAHAVDNSTELVRDPQLLHRAHFIELPHPVHGTAVVEGSRFRLSRTPGRVTRAAPTFGQDNFQVLTEILGYPADRVAELAAAEVFR